MINYQDILLEIREELQPLIGQGKVADYIPALANVPIEKFGMAVVTLNGDVFTVGDARENFSIQSISKVFSLTMAFSVYGDALWKRVGKEPSGNPFNSLVQLEYEKGIPRNPFINAGALVVTDSLISHYPNAKESILQFLAKISGVEGIDFDQEIAESERATGFTNAALVNYLKSHQNIQNDVNQVLDVYFHQCSVKMTCVDLAKSMLFFANHGEIPWSGERLLTMSQSKRLSAIMLTCGFYDEAGEFAFLVGMPGKSGVGGGIVAILPNQMAVAVWSPGLNKHGNSLAGIKALELFTTKMGISIF